MKKFVAVIFLLIFPGVLAETVASANTPAIGLLLPKVFLGFMLIYGLPILLIRDVWVKQRIGPLGLVLMGAVYTAFNEGLIATTWFKHRPLGLSDQMAARAAGINWHIVVNLLLFHTIFSVIIPISLSLMVFRKYNQTVLLNRLTSWLAVGLLVIIALSNATHGTTAGVQPQKLGLLALMVLLISLALFLPKRPARLRVFAIKHPWVVGLTYGLVFLVSFYVLPVLPPVISVGLSLVFYFAVVVFLVRYLASSSLLTQQTLRLIVAALIPAAVISLTRIGQGQPVIVAICLAFLLAMAKRKPTDTIRFAH